MNDDEMERWQRREIKESMLCIVTVIALIVAIYQHSYYRERVHGLTEHNEWLMKKLLDRPE